MLTFWLSTLPSKVLEKDLPHLNVFLKLHQGQYTAQLCMNESETGNVLLQSRQRKTLITNSHKLKLSEGEK